MKTLCKSTVIHESILRKQNVMCVNIIKSSLHVARKGLLSLTPTIFEDSNHINIFYFHFELVKFVPKQDMSSDFLGEIIE